MGNIEFGINYTTRAWVSRVIVYILDAPNDQAADDAAEWLATGERPVPSPQDMPPGAVLGEWSH